MLMHGEAVVLENDIREQWNLLEMTDEILSLQVTDDSQCRNGFLTARKLIVRSQWQEIVESKKEGKNYPQQTFVLKFYFDISRKRGENDLQKFFL